MTFQLRSEARVVYKQAGKLHSSVMNSKQQGVWVPAGKEVSETWGGQAQQRWEEGRLKIYAGQSEFKPPGYGNEFALAAR